jgi:hypothetical protein
MTTATQTAPQTAPTARGFGELPCILCGQTCLIRVDLDDLSLFTCAECGQEFNVEDVRAHAAAWQRVLAWLDAAPAVEG